MNDDTLFPLPSQPAPELVMARIYYDEAMINLLRAEELEEQNGEPIPYEVKEAAKKAAYNLSRAERGAFGGLGR